VMYKKYFAEQYNVPVDDIDVKYFEPNVKHYYTVLQDLH